MSTLGISNMRPAGNGLGSNAPTPRSNGLRQRAARLSDRSCVLMVGVAIGSAIGFAFGSQTVSGPDTTARPVQAAAARPAPAVQKIAAQGFAANRKPALLPQALVQTTIPFCTPAPSPLLLHTLQTGGPVRIGVFGDSFGDGVWAALYHRFPRGQNFEVLRYSKPSTGFTRYQQLNLEEEAKAQLAQGPVDIAVINFGANDDQPLVDDGHGVRLLGDRWRQIYAKRVERYVALLRASGATVYWMGLPRMRKDAYDSDLAELSALVSERMAKLGVPYIHVRDLSVDGRGAYSDYLLGTDGKNRLMRAGDGIHMTPNGYAHLAEPIARQIGMDLAYARAVAAKPDSPPPVQSNCVVLTAQDAAAQTSTAATNGQPTPALDPAR